MFTSSHECGLCTHHISFSVTPGLCLAAVAKGPHFLQKNPPAEISGYGPETQKGFTDAEKQNNDDDVTKMACIFLV